MRRLYQATALFFFALGVYPMWEARELTYWVVIGPGPGFFPFWLGALLALVSGVWFAQVTLRPVEPMSEDFIPGGAGAKKALLTLAALVLFIGLLDVLGFSLTMFGFLLFLILVLGRHNLLLTMTVSLVGSFGIYYVFKYLLSVHLPASSIGFLHSLGL